jgi:hypothetical protein
MTNPYDHHLLLHAHDASSVATCAGKLVDIARKVPNAPEKISTFVDAILTGTPAYDIPKDSKQLALYCARQITEQAAARRKTVAEVPSFHKIEDQLGRFRLTWWGR